MADEIRKTADHAVREWTVSKPRLRRDVEFTFHHRRGVPVYVLEDVIHRRYFQIGLAEYQFLHSLDGNRTISEAVARSASGLGARALSEQNALTLVRWLVDHDLLETESAEQSHRRFQHTEENKNPQAQGGWTRHLMFLKLPMGNPDGLLAVLTPWFGWIFSPFFFVIWLALIGYAASELAPQWDRFIEAAGQAVLPGNWLLMILVFAGLKIVHELGHGLATRRFGGVVPEWGIQLIAFVTPLTYVDASSSWRFTRRRHRIAVAGAGMYVELFFAALAILVWTRTQTGLVNTLAHNVVFAASVVTVLFNANPLMRFDGYYILTDLLNMPNLAQKGQMIVKWAAKRYLIGMKDLTLPPQVTDGLPIVAAYGVGSAIWRILIWVGIMSLVSMLGRGAGVVIVVIAITAMVFGSLTKFVKFLATGSGGMMPSLPVAFTRLGSIAAVLAGLFFLVQFRPFTRAAAVISFRDKAVVRTELDAFVTEVNFENGQEVALGEVLARLENPETETELKSLELDVSHSRLRARKYLEGGQVGAYQAELNNLDALKEKLEAIRDSVNSLTVKAPIDGVVFARRPDRLEGRYLRTGEEVLTVFPNSPPEVIISAREKAVEALRTEANPRLRVRLRGRPGSIPAVLDRVEKQATAAVPHAALASVAGGPLAVLQRAEQDSDRQRGLARTTQGASEELSHFAGLAPNESDTTNLELTRARFTAYASVDLEGMKKGADDLRDGECGAVLIWEGEKKRLGEWLYEGISGWVRAKWERARRAG